MKPDDLNTTVGATADPAAGTPSDDSAVGGVPVNTDITPQVDAPSYPAASVSEPTEPVSSTVPTVGVTEPASEEPKVEEPAPVAPIAGGLPSTDDGGTTGGV